MNRFKMRVLKALTPALIWANWGKRAPMPMDVGNGWMTLPLLPAAKWASPFKVGQELVILGGPFLEAPEGIFSVRMAEEIKRPADVVVPTRDFSVPEMAAFRQGVVDAYYGLTRNGIIYVGCMGGIGRTGLMLAGMVLFHQRMSGRLVGKDPAMEAILQVRRDYYHKAVETTGQIEYLRAYAHFLDNVPFVGLDEVCVD